MLEITTVVAARRTPLPAPPTKVEAAKIERQQAEARRRIGINLKAARARTGLSLRALEIRSGVSANHLSALERGIRNVTVDVLVQIAFHLDTSLADLVTK
jgi:hypothetical protein